jgi:hypothetical protein
MELKIYLKIDYASVFLRERGGDVGGRPKQAARWPSCAIPTVHRKIFGIGADFACPIALV